MIDLSFDEKLILIQYSIKKYENESELISKLVSILSDKDIQRGLDTLIGTQKVRRIGPEVLENNESHTEMPDLSEKIKSIVEKL